MRKIIKYGAVALLFTISTPTFACVEAGFSHSCAKDCESWEQPWYTFCILGGEQHK